MNRVAIQALNLTTSSFIDTEVLISGPTYFSAEKHRAIRLRLTFRLFPKEAKHGSLYRAMSWHDPESLRHRR